MEREQFINQVLNSLESIGKVNPPAHLLSKIEQRISNQNVPTGVIWMAAASIAVLIALNVLAVSQKSSPKNEFEITFSGTLNKNNQLY